MRKFNVLFLCAGILLAAGCAAESSNKTVNVQIANNSNADINKPSNAEINSPDDGKTAIDDDSKNSAVKFGGNWESDQINKNGSKHTGFSLVIRQVGGKIDGTYSVVDYINGEPQIEDGNQTPFTGTINGGTAEIKFDPEATVPGYEEKVEYKEPSGGKKPATAVLVISGDNLTWKTTFGEIKGGLPKEINLTKDTMNQVSEQ